MADWSDLRMDLVGVVADLLLTNAYLEMRAVCHNWRVAIPKPTALGAGDDRRFRPREWVMLDEREPSDGVDGRLFLHVSSGRFLRRRLPFFGYGQYILVGASDGLLVLGSARGLHATVLVNPFTRGLLPFAAPIPLEPWVIALVAGTSPTLFFYFQDKFHDPADMVYCADAASPLCEVQFQGWEDEAFCHRGEGSYAGDIYVVDYNGAILKIMGTAPNYHRELIVKPFTEEYSYYRAFFLVESAGDLLLVTLQLVSGSNQVKVEVFRVNIEQKVLEPVSNIGSRALFLGHRCLSVDADMLPSIDSNCIYCSGDYVPFQERDFVSRYNLHDKKLEDIPNSRPFSLAQTLLQYCAYGALEDITSQLERVRQY